MTPRHISDTTRANDTHPVTEAAAEWVAVSDLHPWDKNPRKNDEAAKQVAESIKRFGFGAPILARRNGEIIAGHTRWKAAHILGLERVPVRYLDLDPAEAHLLALADNKLGEKAEWDDAMVASVLSEYGLDDAEMAGWDEKELEKLGSTFLTSGDITEDSAPSFAEKRCSLGDVWQLGRHRIVCGDSTDNNVVDAVLHGESPFIMVTDPPYGVEYDPIWRKHAGVNNGTRSGVVLNDDRCQWMESYKHSGCNVAYVWHSALHSDQFKTDLERAGYSVRSQLIWHKDRFALSRADYHWQHEPCWYAVKGSPSKWCGDRTQSTTWSINRDDGHGDGITHGTQKPVECMARPIRNHGGKDDHVYDPFLGSGTTLIAAEQLDRTCFGVELNPEYCDIIIQRWVNMTKGEPRKL